MARPRQAVNPVDFSQSNRQDQVVGMTSGRAGEVGLIDYIPVLRGDSASGAITVNCNLGRMPKPLLNAVTMNVQAWFVPKSAMPQFTGTADLLHSYQNENIPSLPGPDRTPPPYFFTSTWSAAQEEGLLKQLGMHQPNGWTFNTDLLDAYSVVYNFRQESYSSKLSKRPYFASDGSTFADINNPARAFWPVGRFSHMVPDYESALVVGELELDVRQGNIPVSGIGRLTGATNTVADQDVWDGAEKDGPFPPSDLGNGQVVYEHGVMFNSPGQLIANAGSTNGTPKLFALMAGETVATTLASIDKARTTQSFAELRTLYAGMNANGYVNDDAIIAELMQGFAVPQELMQRPWLLDSQRAVFGMGQRFSTDSVDLEASVSEGNANVMLSINLPRQEYGGVIIVTCEVVPERLDERHKDEFFAIDSVDMFPDALRDMQREEPVDLVRNARIDTKHADPGGFYGYEPMNSVWNRNFTRLGGAYYQPNPSAPWTEQRSALWLAQTVDPAFTADHWLCPTPFPHDVFMDTTADAWEATVRHNVTLRGLTQFGDVLSEDNNEYEDTKPEVTS